MNRSLLARIERLEKKAKARADKLAKARNPRPYCGEREALTVRVPLDMAETMRADALARGVTFNQVAQEVMRRGIDRLKVSA
jgi:hypothetical protein